VSDRPLATFDSSSLASMAAGCEDPLTVAALLEIIDLRNEVEALERQRDECRPEVAVRRTRGKRAIPEGELDR
jgi:hypothetical protein